MDTPTHTSLTTYNDGEQLDFESLLEAAKTRLKEFETLQGFEEWIKSVEPGEYCQTSDFFTNKLADFDTEWRELETDTETVLNGMNLALMDKLLTSAYESYKMVRGELCKLVSELRSREEMESMAGEASTCTERKKEDSADVLCKRVFALRSRKEQAREEAEKARKREDDEDDKERAEAEKDKKRQEVKEAEEEDLAGMTNDLHGTSLKSVEDDPNTRWDSEAEKTT